jgi:hypothetical protein
VLTLSRIHLAQYGVYADFATPTQAEWLIKSFVEYIKNSGPTVYRNYVNEEAIVELLNDTCYPFSDTPFDEESGLMMFAFETENSNLVGGCLLSVETPWYAKAGTLLSLSEVATFAIPGHAGVTRMTIALMEELSKQFASDCPVVLCAGASIPESATLIANSYRKSSFQSHSVFYKLLNK